MNLSHYFNIVKQHAEERLELLLSLCDSPIEKKFFAHLYCFFLTKGRNIHLRSLESEEFEITEGNRYTSVFCLTNERGINSRITNARITFVSPFTGEVEMLIGIRISCGSVKYDILPQYPVYDLNQVRYLDFAILMIDPTTDDVIGKFAVECDGFEWHSTLPQLNADNIRSRFLTKNDFKVIRYTGSEVNSMTDNTIFELENTMFNSVFQRDSDFYRFHHL